MRVGVDVGGTNTDAVLMHESDVLAKAKTTTTDDVIGGIVSAIGSVVEQHGVQRDAIEAVMIGTTHFTNAVVERRGLSRTAVLRLGLPATQAVHPFEDWPDDLRDAIGGRGYLVHGGNEFDGRELSPLDEREIAQTIEAMVADGVQAVAVSAVFSPVTSAMEERAREIIARLAPNLDVTLSHQIGRLGLLERENAAAINASLRNLASATIASFQASLERLEISAQLYLTQNDGTLIRAGAAKRFPALTFASGPTNSMRGAAFLSGIADGLVLDVGGTTSDIGALVRGFPRESFVGARFADVRTNFRMPDLISLGLGGGSIVRDGATRIGPDSVGAHLAERALVFGGDTLTATDLAVAAGHADIGERAKVAHVDGALVAAGITLIHATLEDALDRMKLSRDPVPVVVVGGGSSLAGEHIAGSQATVRPAHFEVANAVGAAIAQVSGEVDRIYPVAEGRERAIATARKDAIAQAVANGAGPETIEIVDIDDLPVPYMEASMLRVRVKAVGDLLTLSTLQRS